MSPEKPRLDSQGDQPPAAFLIVNGSRLITIDQPVTNIGRRGDNHIIINHEYVSRHHAQIQHSQGRYIILDLNSTVGTSVNGKRIDKAVLRSGDVISVGGVPIIFGFGSPRDDFDLTAPDKIQNIDSGPTQNVDINLADQYLDLFDLPED